MRPLRKILKGADIFIETSPNHSSDSNLLEAMSVGMAVAACCSEEGFLKDRETALFFDGDDEISIYSCLRELCDKDRHPFAVCILNVTGELNVGTIVRSALLTGARQVVIIGRRKYDKRGAVGSQNYIEVERIEGLRDDGLTIDPDVFWGWMAKNGYKPVFVEQGGTPLNTIDWYNWVMSMQPLLPCIVLGNENRGIQDDILYARNSRIASIPQRGVIRSYNVASSAAIVMYDMIRGMRWT